MKRRQPAQAPASTNQPAASSTLRQPASIPPAEAEAATWRWWHALLLLSLLGLILAPVFRAIGIAPFTAVASFIYWLGELVCPLPGTAITLFGQPMAVCPLCYGALIAITLCALSYPVPQRFWGRWQQIAWYLQLGIILVLVGPWLTFYTLGSGGATQWMQLLMLFAGLLGGTGVALLGQMLSELLVVPKSAALADAESV